MVALNSSKFSFFSDNPAAFLCPPNPKSKSLACEIMECKLISPLARALPLATSWVTEKIKAGFLNLLESFEATIPITPSCQSSPQTIIAWSLC